jgi:uncharacterized protein
MRFEWDERKNQESCRKHKIDLADVPLMFLSPLLISLDDRQEYSEERWIGIGLLKSIVAVVIWVERHDDVIRIISARKANRQERMRYEQFLKN